jgi:xanthosine utilization system XapX-like protein
MKNNYIISMVAGMGYAIIMALIDRARDNEFDLLDFLFNILVFSVAIFIAKKLIEKKVTNVSRF